MGMAPEDLAALRRAVQSLEHPGLAARLTNMVGKPIELIGNVLPASATHVITTATAKGLEVALKVALRTMQRAPHAGSRLLHKALATASGGAGSGKTLGSAESDRNRAALALRRRAHCIGDRERSVRAVEELDGHEDHLLIADIFEIMNLVLAGPIGLVPGLAGLIGIFDRRTVMYMLASTSAVHRGPEIIEHVAVETDPLAGSEPNDPHPHALAFREESRADAAVVVQALAVEFCSDRAWPRRFVGAVCRLVQHCQCHGIPPAIVGTI
jgi:hypothetical protein